MPTAKYWLHKADNPRVQASNEVYEPRQEAATHLKITLKLNDPVKIFMSIDLSFALMPFFS